VVRIIEDVTKTTDTGTDEGKLPAPESTNQPGEGTPQVKSPEDEVAELKEEIAGLRKAVTGFQPALQEKSLKLERREAELQKLEEQLAEAKNSDYESPNEGVLTAQLRQKRRDLMEARAQAKAADIVGRYKLPQSLAAKIIAKPLAHIDVPEDATEDTINMDISEQLPSYLDTLVKELGSGGTTTEPNPQVSKEEVPPAPGGGTPPSGNSVYADEIDPKTTGGYARFKELREDIESGKVRVLPSRKTR